MCFFLDLLVLTCNISIETCAYVLLSWYALRGEALRPPPCTPLPAFIFKTVPLATYYSFFFCISIISIIVYLGSFPLCWYPSRLVPMCFFLDLLVLTCNISIETCAYVLLSWYALRGEALRPPPCTPCDLFLCHVSTQCIHACWHVGHDHLIHSIHAHSAWLKTSIALLTK